MSSSGGSEWGRYMNSLDSEIFNNFGISNPNRIGVHAGPVAPRTIQHYYNPSSTTSGAGFSNKSKKSKSTAMPAMPATAPWAAQPSFEPPMAVSEDGLTDSSATSPAVPGAPRPLQFNYAASIAVSEDGAAPSSAPQPASARNDTNGRPARPFMPQYVPSSNMSEDSFTDKSSTSPPLSVASRAPQYNYAPSITVSEVSSASARGPPQPSIRNNMEAFPTQPLVSLYAPSIYMSEDRFPGGVTPVKTGRPKYSPSDAAASMISAANAKSVFDSGESWANTSVTSTRPSEGPSEQTVEEEVEEEEEEPEEEVVEQEPDNGVRLLCEFIAYNNCLVKFGLDEVDAWIDHIAIDHMQNILPREAICWFCNDDSGKYSIEPGREVSQEELETKFRQRMEHIAEHFRTEGKTEEYIRPDFRFLDHVHNHGFISEKMFEIAKAYVEKHPYHVTINPVPFKKPKPNGEYIVERRLGKRGKARREIIR